MDFESRLSTLCKDLVEGGCVLFGNFKLKSGVMSNHYVNLRNTFGLPYVMEDMCALVADYVNNNNLKMDAVCGVPYTGLPIATIVAMKLKLPMVMRRKEAKQYGTKQLVEGVYKKGDRCLIVEDVITSGASILETVADLDKVGLVVANVIVVVDREEGGIEKLRNMGYQVHSLVSISKVVQFLLKHFVPEFKIVIDCVLMFDQIMELRKNELAVLPPKDLQSVRSSCNLPFEKRQEIARSKVAKQIFHTMTKKKTNLCFAADVKQIKELLKLADELGPYISVLKVHTDIFISEYGEEDLEELRNLAQKHNFIIMNDRKLLQYPDQVSLIMEKSQQWGATTMTVHSAQGSVLLENIKSQGFDNLGIFLVAQLSNAGNFLNESCTKETIALGKMYPELVAGFVCQLSSLIDDPGFIQLTPGVNMDARTDGRDQRYSTPRDAVIEKGADLVVVGRGILQAEDRVATARLYRDELWKYYEERVTSH